MFCTENRRWLERSVDPHGIHASSPQGSQSHRSAASQQNGKRQPAEEGAADMREGV